MDGLDADPSTALRAGPEGPHWTEHLGNSTLPFAEVQQITLENESSSGGKFFARKDALLLTPPAPRGWHRVQVAGRGESLEVLGLARCGWRGTLSRAGVWDGTTGRCR